MFNIKYLAMHKVHMHAGVISKLLNDFASVQVIIHFLKLVDYLSIKTHKPHVSVAGHALSALCNSMP